MKILVIGGGGREHAICRKLKASPQVSQLLCAPGNAGIAQVARCFADVKATDIEGILSLAKAERPDFVVVAPDDPLALGAVDRLRTAGFLAYGPTQAAAQLESSKTFAKEFMEAAGVPTAKWQGFDDLGKALSYLKTQRAPIVIKADGLALGKGVIVAETMDEAERALRQMMAEGRFGASGSRVVIEECMRGPEVTVLCFTDAVTLSSMPASQDHKRALEGDRGENTGGMGAIAPCPLYTKEIEERVRLEILEPTLREMRARKMDFRGVLYVGLMLTEEGPRVVEYNARFGDPETQALLPLLQTDLLEIFLASAQQRLSDVEIRWSRDSAACVVLASGGYPGGYETGKEIQGIEEAEALGAIVDHAGTARREGALVTAGGRVLGVTAVSPDLPGALRSAYAAADRVSFEGKQFRPDIGRAWADGRG